MSEKIENMVVNILLDPERCDNKKLKIETLKEVLNRRSIPFQCNSSLANLQNLFAQHIFPKSHNSPPNNNNPFNNNSPPSNNNPFNNNNPPNNNNPFNNNTTTTHLRNNSSFKCSQKIITADLGDVKCKFGDDVLEGGHMESNKRLNWWGACGGGGGAGGGDSGGVSGGDSGGVNDGGGSSGFKQAIKPIIFKGFDDDGINNNHNKNSITHNNNNNNNNNKSNFLKRTAYRSFANFQEESAKTSATKKFKAISFP